MDDGQAGGPVEFAFKVLQGVHFLDTIAGPSEQQEDRENHEERYFAVQFVNIVQGVVNGDEHQYSAEGAHHARNQRAEQLLEEAATKFF